MGFSQWEAGHARQQLQLHLRETFYYSSRFCSKPLPLKLMGYYTLVNASILCQPCDLIWIIRILIAIWISITLAAPCSPAVENSWLEGQMWPWVPLDLSYRLPLWDTPPTPAPRTSRILLEEELFISQIAKQLRSERLDSSILSHPASQHLSISFHISLHVPCCQSAWLSLQIHPASC